MEGAARNSSYSQIRLIKNNYNLSPLLSTFRDKSISAVAASTRMSRLDDGDYNRPPESSDDEPAVPAKSISLPSVSTTSPRSKRKQEPVKGIRASKRRKLANEIDLTSPSTKVEESGTSVEASQAWASFDKLSQASQQSQRKRQKGYGNQQKHKYTATSSHPGSGKLDLTDVVVREDQRSKTKATDLRGDIGDQVDAEPARSITDLSFLKRVDTLEPDSSVSTSTSKQFTLDDLAEPEELTNNPISQHSPPTSPEVVDIDDTLPYIVPADTEPTTVKCPFCRKDVNRTLLPTTVRNTRLLSKQKQKDFCHQHRRSEVDILVKEQKYPTIDWEVLELQRIPNHMDHLRRVLKGKANSYYLDKLRSAITNAKGNRKVIRSYITEGVLDVVKTGYYGPKGTSIMLNQVSDKMSNDLNKMLKDKLVQPVGIGGYAAAVLVPELRLHLVMEDLDIKDEAEARRVLDESTETGLLLYPDEDQIEPDELM